MRDHLVIHVNGRRHAVPGCRAFQSLSDFLRNDLRLAGTKVVCAEGDCGSCTVFVGRPASERIAYRTVTSCIQYLYQLDATHVVTVEGLKYGGQLNPVQEAVVRCHGAQCGYCTPGIVVSLCALFDEQSDRPSRLSAGAAQAGLVGNLCRCTGYEPIVRAAVEVEPGGMKSLSDLYSEATLLPELTQRSREPVLVAAGGRSVYKPTDLADAARFKAEHVDCTIVCGGTDLGVQINKRIREPRNVLVLSHLNELRSIERLRDVLMIGAAVSLSEVERATLEALPEFGRMLELFGSPPIKNAGTLGGNIGNGSPIGDSLPALYVLDAQIELVSPRGSRRVNINDFYTGYKRNVMAADELISRVHLPLPAEGDRFKLYKVSKRRHLDISTFTAAVRLGLDRGQIVDARIAYGGVGPNVLRLRQTEAWLRGRPFDLATCREAGELVRREIRPISDVRGSAAFRQQLAENILQKFYYDTAE